MFKTTKPCTLYLKKELEFRPELNKSNLNDANENLKKYIPSLSMKSKSSVTPQVYIVKKKIYIVKKKYFFYFETVFSALLIVFSEQFIELAASEIVKYSP